MSSVLNLHQIAEEAKLQFVLAVKVNSLVSPALQMRFCFSGNIGVTVSSSSSEHADRPKVVSKPMKSKLLHNVFMQIPPSGFKLSFFISILYYLFF